MNLESSLKNIENFVEGIIAQSPTVFLVDVKITPGNNIIVFLDADDGVSIEKCTQVNKALYKYIEDTDFFPDGNFSLEVSSPGVDEPLKLHRQYKKNIGRSIQVVLNDDNKKEGKLSGVNQNEIIIEEKQGKGNKAVTQSITILFNEIKHTTVLITF